MEIEKKYLIRELPELFGAQKKVIEQGYLCRGPVLRIRKSNDDYILTYKSKQGLQQKNAIQNEEVELPLTKEAYSHLKQKADGYIVEKTRYILPLPEGRKAELDIFSGRLCGLVFVEVEFDSEEQAVQFIPPAWFGEDVSAEEFFSNAYLSTVENYDDWMRRRSIVKDI